MFILCQDFSTKKCYIIAMKISEYIREILQENELSQTQLAQILNVSQKAISNWVNDIDKPNAASLIAIYEKFGITPNELLNINTSDTQIEQPEDEILLLRAYRKMSEGKKRALFQMLDIDQTEIKKRNSDNSK